MLFFNSDFKSNVEFAFRFIAFRSVVIFGYWFDIFFVRLKQQKRNENSSLDFRLKVVPKFCLAIVVNGLGYYFVTVNLAIILQAHNGFCRCEVIRP